MAEECGSEHTFDPLRPRLAPGAEAVLADGAALSDCVYGECASMRRWILIALVLA